MVRTPTDVEQWLLTELRRSGDPELLALRQRLALSAFMRGNLSLRDASDLAGVSPVELGALAEEQTRAELSIAMGDEARLPAPRLSIVLPVYNEEANLPLLWERLQSVLCDLGPYEVIFVDDGSRDRTAEMVLEIRLRHPAVKLISFSRNFGHQAALTAGIDHARGEAVVLMDADLQDPPELLPELLDQWRSGHEVVYAVRRKRKEGVMKRGGYHLFYRLLRTLASIDIPLDAGDFCLMDRCVVDHLKALPEKNRFLRGLRSWVGYSQVGVPYERPARHAGEPKYTVRRLLKLALDGLLAFTSVPLRLSVYLGGFTALAGLLGLCAAVAARLFGGRVPPGWTSLIATMLLLGGIQLLVMGVLGEYVARIYDETKERPIYIIDALHGITP